MGADINVHDQWACESMGAIQDRTAGASRHIRQGDQRLSPAAAAGDRAGGQGREADDGARSGACRRASPARRRSTASARPTTGRAIGRRPTQASARLRAGRMGTESQCPPRSRQDPASFVERHDLWSAAQAQAAAQVERDRSRTKSSRSCASRSPTSTACCAARRCSPPRPPARCAAASP